ncbi:MAG TPA: hypothetical protein VIT42_07405 [Microlunatus sp.]
MFASLVSSGAFRHCRLGACSSPEDQLAATGGPSLLHGVGAALGAVGWRRTTAAPRGVAGWRRSTVVGEADGVRGLGDGRSGAQQLHRNGQQ